VLLGALGSLLGTVRLAHAADPPPRAAASPRTSAHARARDLFFQGIAQQDAGDWERALAFFRRSLDEASTWRSTMNAAFCLGKLTRYDEALEAYEALLTSFAAQLPATERLRVDAAITYLKQQVVSIEITANVESRVSIDGRPRGSVPRGGPLQLRVTADTHHVEITKEGFKAFDRTMAGVAGASILLYAVLERAPTPAPAPRPWPHDFLTAFASYATGSLGSTAERTTSWSSFPVNGFVVGMRGGHYVSSGLDVEITLGYLFAESRFHRTVDNPSFIDQSIVLLNYDLTDRLQLRGPFLGVGVSYRAEVNDHVDFFLRTTFGLLSAESTDPVAGHVCKRDEPCTGETGRDVSIRGNGQRIPSTSGLLMPEIGLNARWGGFRAGVSLGLIVLTTDGPSFRNRQAGVNPAECTRTSTGGSLACVPNKSLGEQNPNDLIKNNQELVYGAFATLLTPQVVVAYSF
jgi:hypothetical protein